MNLRKLKDSASDLVEGEEIVFGAPGCGFPTYEEASKLVGKNAYDQLDEKYWKKLTDHVSEYYEVDPVETDANEMADLIFQYSEVYDHSCGFISTIEPDETNIVEFLVPVDTDEGKLYVGLMGV